jgi:hypothetical protein
MSQSRTGSAGWPEAPEASSSPAKNSPRYLRPVAAGAGGKRLRWLSGGGDGGGGGGVFGGSGGGAGGEWNRAVQSAQSVPRGQLA